MTKERVFSNSERGSRERHSKIVQDFSEQQREAVPFDAKLSVETETEQVNREDDRNLVIGKVKKYIAENTYKNVQLTIEPRNEGTAILADDATPTLLGAGYTLELSRSDEKGSATQWSQRVAGEAKDGIMPARVLLSQFKYEKLQGGTKALFAGIDIDTHIKPLSDGKSLWISDALLEHLIYASDQGLAGAFKALIGPITRSMEQQTIQR